MQLRRDRLHVVFCGYQDCRRGQLTDKALDLNYPFGEPAANDPDVCSVLLEHRCNTIPVHIFWQDSVVVAVPGNADDCPSLNFHAGEFA